MKEHSCIYVPSLNAFELDDKGEERLTKRENTLKSEAIEI